MGKAQNVQAEIALTLRNPRQCGDIGINRRLCCPNPLRDSSCDSSMVAVMHEQTDTTLILPLFHRTVRRLRFELR